jgi:hypothetical protein
MHRTTTLPTRRNEQIESHESGNTEEESHTTCARSVSIGTFCSTLRRRNSGTARTVTRVSTPYTHKNHPIMPN